MKKFSVLVLSACVLQSMSASADGVVKIHPLFAVDSTTEISDEFVEDGSEDCSRLRAAYGQTEAERAKHLSALQDGECAINYKLGETGPAGGQVFHTTDDGIHGLEAAAKDISELEWGCHSIQIDGASGVGIGEGKANFETLATYVCASVSSWGGSTVFDAVQDYEVNGFTDWYIPSRDEMKHMHTVLTSKGVGNFAHNLYLVSTVSTHSDNRWVWMIHGGTGRYWYGERSLRKPVRPIRSF